MRKKGIKSAENETVPRKLCSWNDHGMPCNLPAPLSSSTNGMGPWYCREHFAKLMGWPSWQAAVTDESQDAVDARVQKIVPRKTGESLHDWSMRCRDWVILRLEQRRQEFT